MAKSTAKKISEEISFEAALAELEQISEQLEADELSIDKSIQSYDRAQQLLDICSYKLNEVKDKIEVIDKQYQRKAVDISDMVDEDSHNS